jgi:hypothetical protein
MKQHWIGSVLQEPRTDREQLEQLLDEALKDTFPASDPVAISVREPPEPSFDGSRASRSPGRSRSKNLSP